RDVTVGLAFSPQEAQGIVALAREAGVPVKRVLFAAHLNALRAFMGGVEVKTGLVIHARPEADDEDQVVGLFLNTVPVHFTSKGGSWRDLVREALRLEEAAQAHRVYPVVEV